MMTHPFTTCPMVLRNRYLKSRNERLTASKIPEPLGYGIILAGWKTRKRLHCAQYVGSRCIIPRTTALACWFGMFGGTISKSTIIIWKLKLRPNLHPKIKQVVLSNRCSPFSCIALSLKPVSSTGWLPRTSHFVAVKTKPLETCAFL